MEEKGMELPPGFRFHPTNEEIITHYLLPKILDHSFTSVAIAEVNLNKCEPWDLPSKAKMGGNEVMYFFSHRDKKYPMGMRTNRATEFGYWKATGKDKEIHEGRGNLVGTKKTLVFYKGRAPRGEKTNWVMHEFKHQSKDEWVVCRVLYKNEKPCQSKGSERIQSFGDELLLPSYDFKVNRLLPSPPPPMAMNFSTEPVTDDIDWQLPVSLQDQSSYCPLPYDEALLRGLATTNTTTMKNNGFCIH